MLPFQDYFEALVVATLVFDVWKADPAYLPVVRDVGPSIGLHFKALNLEYTRFSEALKKSEASPGAHQVMDR
jgi:hypothetical protein